MHKRVKQTVLSKSTDKRQFAMLFGMANLLLLNGSSCQKPAETVELLKGRKNFRPC